MKAFFLEGFQRAYDIRAGLNQQTNSFRLVHGESDDLPGLVIDCYGSNLVIQILSAGAERWKETIVSASRQVTKATGVYERSDVDVRRLEGLEEHTGLIRGELENPFELIENGIHFWADLEKGQKTGFYLDQRINRQKIIDYAKGRRALNCFCYSGGFSLYALSAGAAEVVSVDSSEEALEPCQAKYASQSFF